jgi:hypothetical protein
MTDAMEKLTYWQQVWGGERVERQRINQAASELGTLQSTTDTLQAQVTRLLELDRIQAREIARAETAIWVLMQMLAEAGVLDGEMMSMRIKQAFAAMDAKGDAAPSQTTGPYR